MPGLTIKGVKLSERTVSYLETILWAETITLPAPEDELVDGYMDVDDEHALSGIHDGAPLDDHFGFDDFTVKSLRKAQADCDAFFDALESAGIAECAAQYADDGRIAHDFWLTRNGHGAGFWDGDYDGGENDIGDALTAIAKGFAGMYVSIDDDGNLHLED